MYIMIHRTGKDLPDASAEFAARVLAKATNKEILSLNNGIFMKIPAKEGDSEVTRKFFQRYPKFIPNYSRMPDESEAVEYLLNELDGKIKVGYRFLTQVLDDNRVKYDLIDRTSI